MINPINSNKYPFTFKANIKFCTEEEYDANKPENYEEYNPQTSDYLFRKQQDYTQVHPDEASFPWNIQSITNERNLVTGKTYTCSAGGITGYNNHSLSTRYHFVAEEPNIQDLRSQESKLKAILNCFNNFEIKSK